MLDSLVHTGNTRAVGTSTRAVACALTSKPRPQELLLDPVEEGSGCGPAGLVPRAAASWADRASSCTFLVADSDCRQQRHFFPETNLSHDGPHRSQGDFCVSMIGRAALRCKNAESRDVLREQLKRRPQGKNNTQNNQKTKRKTIDSRQSKHTRK